MKKIFYYLLIPLFLISLIKYLRTMDSKYKYNIIVIILSICCCLTACDPRSAFTHNDMTISNNNVLIEYPIYDYTGNQTERLWLTTYSIPIYQADDELKNKPLTLDEIMMKCAPLTDSIKVFSKDTILLKTWYGPFRDDAPDVHDFFNRNAWKCEVEEWMESEGWGKKVQVIRYHYTFTITDDDLKTN